MRLVLFALFALALLIFGCASFPIQQPQPQEQGTSTEDYAHGCVTSSGYRWCEAKQECLRLAVEPCTVEQRMGFAKEKYCKMEDLAELSVCGDYAKAVSSLSGGGTLYFDDGGGNFTCPLVNSADETSACRKLRQFNCTKVECGGQLANPPAAYCVEKGYKYEIRENSGGSGDGACVFPNGNECGGWAYYQGECDENGIVGRQLANGGEACDGIGGLMCEGRPPEKPDDTFFICPEVRPDACTEEYYPVCGQSVQAGEVAVFKNYGNQCMACSKGSNAVGYLIGTCDRHGK